MACYCDYVPTGIKMTSKLFILQHPNEENRSLRTARMLELGCPTGHCTVIKGKKFTSRHPLVKQLVDDPKTLILFPCDTAVNVDTIPPNEGHNLVLIDGTWNQARSMYFHSPELHTIRKVLINVGRPSEYVIRTQPNDKCLSTVESAALALSHLEGDPTLFTKLTRPLIRLCDIQLQHGAVPHHSREYEFRNGDQPDKPMTRQMRRRMGLFTNPKTKTPSIT